MDARARVCHLVGLAGLVCASACCPKPGTATPDASDPAPEADHAEASYYALPGLDHGLIQSPVNILSSELDAGVHSIELSYERRGLDSVVNKGHTIELEFPAGISIEFEGKTYSVVQTHFHTPSEHLVDGVTYPMEMHVVSTAPGPSADDPPNYLVFGLLFKMGAQSDFIARVLDAVPSEGGEERELESLYLTDLFAGGEAEMAEEIQAVYHYQGSLTTPPYTETVEWFVLKHVFEAAPEQIAAINEIEGDNARHVQMLFGRDVEG